MATDANWITGIIGVAGTVVGAATQFIIAWFNKKIEYRSKKEEYLRTITEQRFNELYEPLLKLINELSASRTELEFDRTACEQILKFIQEKQRFASPELQDVYNNLYYSFHNDSQFDQNTMYHCVRKEYDALKSLLGYGAIVIKSSKINEFFKKIVADWKWKRLLKKRGKSQSKSEQYR